MEIEIVATTVMLAWLWCVMRLVFFITFEIAYILPVIITLDRFATPSSKTTSSENITSKAIGYATREDVDEKKKKNIFANGKEEEHLNELISELEYIEKQKTWIKLGKLL
ncbi:hypothetical protein NPIL_11121 [Nephila pilipes]|uniref:Transmembrane protein n=1 Tax=Nephila pilipes TaxID=299642 RepID=A0A8X6PWS9_NEPPI|nr:hypothetical protein NPIL_11121 [Nephila pilipes]